MYEAGDIVGDYRLERIIARGGMGIIWKARAITSGTVVAIKMIANDLMADPGFRVRIQDEAHRHQRLLHPNIVRVLDVLEDAGVTCIVMEFIHGDSLTDILERQPDHRMPESRARKIIREALKGLNYAHSEHAIWHRDIKPSNIIIDAQDHVHIIDFGIALAYGEERRTRTGQTVGTADYMSPEQITRPDEIFQTADVYSTGCVLYEMLTGRPPFVRGEEGIGTAEFSLQQAHVNKKPVPPKRRVRDLTEDINQIVMDALEKDYKGRIPGCGVFLQRLEKPKISDVGLKEQAAMHIQAQPVMMWVKRQPFYLWIFVALLLVLLFLAVING